jgi:tight adherence protein B
MLTFAALALVLVLVGAAALTAALMLSRKTRLEMEQRVNLVTGARGMPMEAAGADGGLLKAGTKKFDEQVRRIFTVGIKRTWAMRAGTLTLLLAAVTSAGGVWVLTHQFFKLSPPLSALVCLSASFLVPRLILSREQNRTESKFTDLFPDAVDTVARMVRAGLPITAAVRTVANEATPPISTVFAAIADQLKIGVPIEDTLDESSAKIGLPDFRFFTVAVGLQYATGGNLTQTLEILSDIIRKRRAARLKAKAATGEIRITAYTLGGIPIFTIGALLVIQPGYLVPLWTDPRGHLILAMAGVGFLLAFLSMRAMMRSVTNV